MTPAPKLPALACATFVILSALITLAVIVFLHLPAPWQAGIAVAAVIAWLQHATAEDSGTTRSSRVPAGWLPILSSCTKVPSIAQSCGRFTSFQLRE